MLSLTILPVKLSKSKQKLISLKHRGEMLLSFRYAHRVCKMYPRRVPYKSCKLVPLTFPHTGGICRMTL